ncbi:transglycosylase SLT domain-containing protein [Stappia stellulata]|uniref:transglycosylase SLT domain-containing protein n=1 Tax=Stappia stellulata TaxID=71235 RepID=UPI0003FB977F|nr:transglycosylase SLT domain-containing protein [Stappia stellulata]
MKVGDPSSIASRIEQAFQSASTTTGASFEYLVKTAQRESNFDEDAKARTSSASGLFQFIESTWLETLKQSGHKHGLGQYADQIQRSSGGRYKVADADMRREILALRDNAEIASKMAGELTQKNAEYLSRKLGRAPNEGELYIAHFLGAGGANKLIRLAETQPTLAADRVFSKQARANKPIFYEKGGARTVSEVYANLVAKHGGPTPTIPGLGTTRMAALPAAKPQLAGNPVTLAAVDNAVPVDAAMPGRELSMGDPTSRVLTAWSATNDISSPFHALFRNGVEAKRASFDSTFLTAFAAQEVGQQEAVQRAAARQTSDGDAYSDRRSRVLAQLETTGTASLGAGRPMDLTGFLNYRPSFAQKELLPPV